MHHQPFVRRRRGSRWLAAVVAAGALLGAACGSDDKASDTTAAPTTSAAAATSTTAGTATTTAATTADTADIADATTVPASLDIVPDTTGGSTDDTTAITGTPGSGDTTSDYSVETANGVVTLDAKPEKIVSLSAAHTETLFAIGAGPQVIAVDDQSNYPAEAAAVASDLSGYTPNVEAIAGYDPDLVVIAGDTEDGVVGQLEDLDIPVWVGPAATTLDDVYSEIVQLGTLTGNGDAASTLVSDMQDEITRILDEVPETEVPLTYYHELDNTYFSVTSNTFIGQLYGLVGLENIADATAESGNDYPQLNSELIVTSNPDLIFLADVKCCGESKETVAGRDGWADIAAVKNDHVIELDDDIASRWGPRVVDLLQVIVDAVKSTALVPAG